MTPPRRRNSCLCFTGVIRGTTRFNFLVIDVTFECGSSSLCLGIPDSDGHDIQTTRNIKYKKTMFFFKQYLIMYAHTFYCILTLILEFFNIRVYRDISYWISVFKTSEHLICCMLFSCMCSVTSNYRALCFLLPKYTACLLYCTGIITVSLIQRLKHSYNKSFNYFLLYHIYEIISLVRHYDTTILFED